MRAGRVFDFRCVVRDAMPFETNRDDVNIGGKVSAARFERSQPFEKSRAMTLPKIARVSSERIFVVDALLSSSSVPVPMNFET